MKFESMNKSKLKMDLVMAGYVIDRKAQPNVAGQLHQWYKQSLVRGVNPPRMSMRNAAKKAGLISG